MPQKKLYIKTFGCDTNVYDSQRMIDILKSLQYEVCVDPQEADLVILNTCHIREKATEKVYSDLGRIRALKQERLRQNQGLLIAVAGCTAQAEGAEILRRAKYVDLVFGPQSYQNLPQLLSRAQSRVAAPGQEHLPGIIDIDFPDVPKFDLLPENQSAKGPTAPLVIQEGRDKFCHFCVVPYTRGAEYSRPGADVIKEARQLVGQGVREITLLGQNVNAYHGTGLSGDQEWTLGRLCLALAEIPGLDRIRYTTSHPNDVDDSLIQAHRDIPQLMPYLHLPVQSGSDKILKAMNRKHTVDSYRRIMERFRHARSDIAFSSDFIVGYPGETDEDYLQTIRLVSEMAYVQAYCFTYSPRPGTPAANLTNQVSAAIKSERLAGLQALVQAQQAAFNRSLVGKQIPILFEKAGRHPGQLIGRSPYLQSVHVYAPPRLLGQIVSVDITASQQNSLAGEIVHTELEHAYDQNAA